MREPDSHSLSHTSGLLPGEQRVLADFLRRQREELVRDWEAGLRERRPEGTTGGPLLRYHVRELLDALADDAEHPSPPGTPRLALVLPDEHAVRRLEMGYAPEEAVLEYGLLRQCILQGLVHEGHGLPLDLLEWLEEAVQQGLSRIITHHTRVRERRFEALERVSEAARESEGLDAFLPRLLGVLMEAVATVDGASILLREGDTLRLRAAAGIGAEQALAEGITLPLDQGFTGRVATERHPLSLRSASTYPGLGYDALRRLGLRAAYSVPLFHDERVIGVAHMSSRTVFDLEESDKLLFRTLLTGATGFIVQADLAERERAARSEAERALAQVDSLLEAAPVGIAFLDRELRYLGANDTLAEQIERPSVQHHLGRTLRDIVPGWVADMLEPQLRRILTTGEPVLGHEFTTQNESESGPRHWLGNYYPVRTRSGEVQGVGCVMVDITRQKQVEGTLRHAGEVREQLIGVLGHDLRNPLSAISASAFLLQRGDALNASGKRAVERIQHSSARMGRMLNDILDFARSSMGGGLPVHRAWVNLSDICRNTLEELQMAWPGRQLELHTSGDPWGAWDGDRLAQVVGNLVSNALRHGREDTPVTVEIHDAGLEVLLSVHNQGTSIPPPLMRKLFQPFQHGTTGKAAGGSVGLGLYIVQQVAHAHGGHVEVLSLEEKGTRFTVRLPRGTRD